MYKHFTLACWEIAHTFVSTLFLDTKIQAVTHDSIEDARTAIKLYHKYQEITEQGKPQ